MRVFVVTSFDYGVGHSRPLCAFASNAEAAEHARDQDLQEDSIADEHRVTELVVIPEVGGEHIPTRDELRELRAILEGNDERLREFGDTELYEPDVKRALAILDPRKATP